MSVPTQKRTVVEATRPQIDQWRASLFCYDAIHLLNIRCKIGKPLKKAQVQGLEIVTFPDPALVPISLLRANLFKH